MPQSVFSVSAICASGASAGWQQVKISRRGRHDPRARLVGHGALVPLRNRRGERLLRDLLGEIEIAQETNQGRDDAPRLFAVEALDRGRRRHPEGSLRR